MKVGRLAVVLALGAFGMFVFLRRSLLGAIIIATAVLIAAYGGVR